MTLGPRQVMVTASDNSHLSDELAISVNQRPVYREVITVHNTQMSAEFRPVSGMKEIRFVEDIFV